MKYYYDDVLAAAWMAKYFGMEFEARYKPIFQYNGQLSFQPCDRFDIHPDKVRLLEPKIGDLVITDLIQEIGATYVNQSVFDLIEAHGSSPTMKIIQREGVPFHWPKSC